MKILFPVILVIFLSFSAFSQVRYLETITDEISVKTHTYTTKDGENLELDIYMPEYDAETERPTIIYVHGGGFESGKRDSKEIKEFCTSLAEYGYVVASISYRLTRKGKEGAFGCDCPAIEKLNTFNAAVEDLQDATFYLIQNHEEFAIDPQKIILAGSSAGAETALIAAYQPPNCYDLPSGPVSYAGVISMAGAIPDTLLIYDESAAPTLLFHGTDDNLVPYATAPHHYCDEKKPGYLILHGSYTIAEKLNRLGVPHWLHTTCGAGHEMHNKPMALYFDEIIDFSYHFIIQGEKESRTTVVPGKQNSKAFAGIGFCNE
jgi:acetyl esterase/lipase